MTFRKRKLKILALHGYQQSDKIFNVKIGSLRKMFKKEIDFIVIKAPHKILNIEEFEQEGTLINPDNIYKYGWWFNSNNNVFKSTEQSTSCIGFNESVELIKKTFTEQGPIDGLLGFSQGGSFVSILCAMQQKKIISINFRFAIIISSFKSLSIPHEIYYNEKLLLPTLHVYGENDKIILPKISEELSNLFINKEVIVHQGGHCVPSKKYVYNNFMKTIIKQN